ncbi:ATP-binding protein [Actinocorallia populi]|uniref:ATP-binding protein n=1 Tax=Actinocorallia populi TaxID=2079200 RepID=UPI000D08B614|nr:ATP-binding protein [Actinocorallia populi]
MGALAVLGIVEFEGGEWAVTAARRYARGLLEQEGIEDWEASLVVTELAANAVAHGGEGGFGLAVSVGEDVVRIEVGDSGPGRGLRVREAGEDDEEGRGLLLVDGLSRRWGAVCRETGTTVWVELERRPASPAAAEEAGR